MIVLELIKILQQFPLDLDVTIDTDDGFEGNYMEIRNVREIKNVLGSFIVIDADVKYNKN